MKGRLEVCNGCGKTREIQFTQFPMRQGENGQSEEKVSDGGILCCEKVKDLISQEHERLANIYAIIERMAADRTQTIAKHDAYIKELEKERLESVSWKEKNDLALRLVDAGHHDPRKYLLEYKTSSLDSPYFGIIGIHDNDRKIGNKEYLIGKQALLDGNRVVVVDWRRAEISRLFFDYEQGEDYLEDIQGREREGIITRKHKVGIDKKLLHRIETPSDTYELSTDGEWRKNGVAQTTADTKSDQQDHRMVDIVSLISADQFRMITKQTDGCTFITGGAGSGKTTVAIHRLSYLQFNYPDQFSPERCLVLMFNRVLKDYVKKTSEDLLGKTKVDTFSAWALTAVNALGIHNLKTTFDDPYSTQKKSSRLSELLKKYVLATARIEPVSDLWRFLSQENVIQAVCPGKSDDAFAIEVQKKIANRDRTISFSDLSILLRLCQLRQPKAIVSGALNWYCAHLNRRRSGPKFVRA